MPNFILVITVVTLAVIGSSLCIKMVVWMEKDGASLPYCLEKDKENLICEACNDINLNQQFYLFGDLELWYKPDFGKFNTPRSSTSLSGVISTACPNNKVYAFLNNTGQFSDQWHIDKLYFRLRVSNPFKSEQNRWEILQSSNTGFCLTREPYSDSSTKKKMTVRFAECTRKNYDNQLWQLANFHPDEKSSCNIGQFSYFLIN